MTRCLRPLLMLAAIGSIGIGVGADDAPAPELIRLMADELQYSMKELVNDDAMRPYYLAYTITDTASESIVTQLGAVYRDDTNRQRMLDVDLRVGDYQLDNTHKIRGGRMRGFGLRVPGGGARAVCGCARSWTRTGEVPRGYSCQDAPPGA